MVRVEVLPKRLNNMKRVIKSEICKSPLVQCMAEEREKLLAVLRASLAAREDVLFAYVYGSFAANLSFHDIDVGVYLASASERKNVWADIELARDLELAVRQALIESRKTSDRGAEPWSIPVDVRVLNQAPTSFSYHVLRGELLFSRNEEVRVSWVAQTVARYLDLKPLRHRALKEAMTSWA